MATTLLNVGKAGDGLVLDLRRCSARGAFLLAMIGPQCHRIRRQQYCGLPHEPTMAYDNRLSGERVRVERRQEQRRLRDIVDRRELGRG